MIINPFMIMANQAGISPMGNNHNDAVKPAQSIAECKNQMPKGFQPNLFLMMAHFEKLKRKNDKPFARAAPFTPRAGISHRFSKIIKITNPVLNMVPVLTCEV